LKKYLVFPLIIIILASLAFSCTSKSTSTSTSSGSAKTLTIGEVDAMTGMFSDIMKYVPPGEQLAKDYINGKGGVTVGGQQYLINIEVRDSKSTPEGATAAANELVFDKKLKFIAGTGPASLTTAIDAVTESAGVLYTAIYQNGMKTEMGTKYPLKFVGNNCSYSGQATAMAYLKQKYPNVKTLAFVLVGDGQRADNDPVVRATATKLGLTIVGDTVEYAAGTSDFTPIAQKAIALKTDGIMIGNGVSAWFGLILKAIRGLGYTGPVFTCSYPVLPDVAQIAGADANGFFGPSIPSEATINGLPPITKDIINAAIAKDSTIGFTTLHLQGFGAVYSLVQAIQAANSLDPKVVAAKWENMEAIDTIFGPGKMGGLQTFGVNHNVYFKTPISVINNGKVVFGAWISLDDSRMP
jgi:ABC-type branched-subunit amino acid transport system substrate-binding protein